MSAVYSPQQPQQSAPPGAVLQPPQPPTPTSMQQQQQQQPPGVGAGVGGVGMGVPTGVPMGSGGPIQRGPSMVGSGGGPVGPPSSVGSGGMMGSVAPPPSSQRGGVPPSPSPAQIQKILDDNCGLIQTIQDFQTMGKAQECMTYHMALHRNLVYLAQLADPTMNIAQILPVSFNSQ